MRAPAWVIVVSYALGVVWLASAIGKVLAPWDTLEVFEALGVGSLISDAAVRLVVAAEVGLGLLLLADSRGRGVHLSAAALVLLLAGGHVAMSVVGMWEWDRPCGCGLGASGVLALAVPAVMLLLHAAAVTPINSQFNRRESLE